MSLFRDLTHAALEAIVNPSHEDGKILAPQNKRVLAKRAALKADDDAAAAAADPKKKQGKEPPKKEEAPPAKGGKPAKGAPTAEEEAAEEERKRQEEEEAERRRLEELEANFARDDELARMGGKVYDFNKDDEDRRSQHYEWLLPVFFRPTQTGIMDTKCMYLETRTTTIKRTIVPSVEEHNFGEIPVKNRETAQVWLKNVGIKPETMRLEPLTPFGGFSVLNAMRTIMPGESKPIVISFIPDAQKIYEERLVIYSDSTMVSVNLKGQGVKPEVKIEPE